MALTEDDIQKLKDSVGTEFKIGEVVDDPIELSPEYDVYKFKVTKKMSREMKELRDEGYTTYEIADIFGVSQTSVRRHINDKIKWTDKTVITDSMCAVMREMGHDGFTMREIADKFDCNPASVSKHISKTTNRKACEHTNAVPRVSYD